MLSNAEKLPDAFTKTKDNFLASYHKDKEWEGVWYTHPEGYVDIEDMKLSSVDLRVKLEIKSGEVSGIIATNKMCNTIPAGFVFLEGDFSGKVIKATVFDWVGGKKTTFAKLLLEREGVVMTVSQTEGTADWFPQKARLGRHISLDNPEKDKLFEDNLFPALCKLPEGQLSKSHREKK